MKILHLIDIPWWSGLAAYAFDCIEVHRGLGHSVTLLCEKNSLSQKKAAQRNIPYFTIRGRQFWNAPSNFFALRRRISNISPDLIVSHTGSTHGMAVFLGNVKKIPVIRTRAVAQPARSGFLSYKTYSQTKWIVAASEKLRRECLERISPDLADKIRTLVPPAEISGTYSSVKSREKKIGILARLDPKKGYDDFLAMARKVQDAVPEAEFHAAGAEENLSWNELFGRSQNMGLKRFYYHGFLTEEKVGDFLRECSVGIIASLGSEEVSRALLEWMAAGRAVVATQVGCIPEILKVGEGGFLVPPAAPSKMAEKVLQILRNPALCEKMGKYNWDLCRSFYSGESFRKKWEELLRGR